MSVLHMFASTNDRCLNISSHHDHENQLKWHVWVTDMVELGHKVSFFQSLCVCVEDQDWPYLPSNHTFACVSNSNICIVFWYWQAVLLAEAEHAALSLELTRFFIDGVDGRFFSTPIISAFPVNTTSTDDCNAFLDIQTKNESETTATPYKEQVLQFLLSLSLQITEHIANNGQESWALHSYCRQRIINDSASFCGEVRARSAISFPTDLPTSNGLISKKELSNQHQAVTRMTCIAPLLIGATTRWTFSTIRASRVYVDASSMVCRHDVSFLVRASIKCYTVTYTTVSVLSRDPYTSLAQEQGQYTCQVWELSQSYLAFWTFPIWPRVLWYCPWLRFFPLLEVCVSWCPTT